MECYNDVPGRHLTAMPDTFMIEETIAYYTNMPKQYYTLRHLLSHKLLNIVHPTNP